MECPNIGCGKKFGYRMQKKRHLVKCEYPEDRRKAIECFSLETDGCKCKVCLKMIKYSNNISRHLKECKPKSDPKEFPCSTCNKVFRYQSKLNAHIVTHAKKQFLCEICDKTYKLESSYTKHIEECGESYSECRPSFVQPGFSNLQSPHNIQPCFTFSPQVTTPTTVQDVFINFEVETHSTPLSNEIKGSAENNVTMEENNIFLEEYNDLQLEYPPEVVVIDCETPPRTKQYRSSKKVICRSRKIDSILEDIEGKEREHILLKSMMQTEMHQFTTSTLQYFKNVFRNARRSHSTQIEASKLLTTVFGDDLWDGEFQTWLANQLNLNGREELVDFLEYEDEDVIRVRRNILPLYVRQQVYDFWKANSQVSIYRSNNRHFITITKSNMLTLHNDQIDDDVWENEKKKNKLECHRKFVSLSYDRLHKIFTDTTDIKISLYTFKKLKPFYVTPVTVKEMETCLCAICLNNHCLYNAIKRNVIHELPDSLSEYICGMIKCDKNPKLCFHNIECISGKCKNKCGIRNVADDFKSKISQASVLNNKISYYVFEYVTTNYFDNNGKKVSYKRTARVDKQEILEEIVMQLQANASSYITHRFLDVNNTFYWKNFLKHSKFYTLWIDYAQNIAFKEKRQAQSAHYSGTQQTLHNTLMKAPFNRKRTFVYHLLNDTNHDSILTFTILEDIISKHPEVIQHNHLVIRSDNCTSQFKCKYVFSKMAELAKKYNITIVWFYGVAGHGKGTVDAMSSFGCKKPLSHAIIAEDKWFVSARDMVNYLNEHFKDDDSKEHYFVDDAVTSKERKKKKREHKIKNSRKYHVISVNPDGKFTNMVYFKDDEFLINLDLNNNCNSTLLEIDNATFAEEKEEEEEYDINQLFHKDTLFELIEPG